MNKAYRVRVCGALVAACASLAILVACKTGDTRQAGIPDRPDYNWDVRPILSQNCLVCHGNDNPKAGLRLDIAAQAYGELPESPGKRAIVPGSPRRSELVRRISSSDPDVRMPPKESHKKLSDTDIAILTRWIDQGARYKPHWAYAVPEAARPPNTRWNERAVNAIDRFIFARLEVEGLKPAPEADSETLINRVSLDLTGLPPTLAEVDTFVADKSRGAYEKLVDRLLASRHYAERQANIWLDVARFADSDGLQFDLMDIYQFPYRDWLISAFLKNLPYDQFVTWQLAGDKFDKPTREQLIATAFGRLGVRTNEAGVIDEEYRVNYATERAELVGKAFLGLTVACAKCHDHKYDVISQADYYSMFAFFNQMNERGISSPGYFSPTGPTLGMPSPKQEAAVTAAAKAAAEKSQAYRSALQAAVAAAAPEAARIATQSSDQRVAYLQRASMADLKVHYPLDEAHRGDITYLKQGRDGRPLALAKGPLRVRLETPEGGSKGFKRWRMADPALPRLAGEDLALAAEEKPSSELKTVQAAAAELFAAEAAGKPAGPTLPAHLSEKRLLLSASGIRGGKSAALQDAKLIQGVSGSAMKVSKTSIGIGYPGLGVFDRTDSFSVDLWIRPRPDQQYRDAILLQGKGYELRLMDNRAVFRLVHDWPYNAIAVWAMSPVAMGRWSQITFTYDGSSKASGVRLYLDGEPVALEVEQDQLTGSTDRGSRFFVADSTLRWGHVKSFGVGGDEFVDGALDEIRVFARALTPLEAALLHEKTLVEQASATELQVQIAQIIGARSPAVAQARDEMVKAVLAQEQAEIPVLNLAVMKDRSLYRKTYVLDRGLYNAPQLDAEVQPQALPRVFPWSTKYRRDRLGLTQWLFDPKNPLTARVFVNRMWQARFGTGIVATVEDFGYQGSNPTHPELLDWLAVEFRRSGWDIKHMHKLMVMSATYRQSSNLSDELIEKDPGNHLLARGPRFRMPAELIRDNALFASGLLVDDPGGDSVFPYQPPGVWDFIGVSDVPYPKTVPQDQNHRRSMYTFVRRGAPYPSLAVFDMPSRNVSTVARGISNTPLQALVLLNDPQYVESFRKLAERAIKSGEGDRPLITLFRLAARRHPAAEEIVTLRRYLAAETEIFRDSPQSADKLLAVGVAPRDPQLDKTTVAAMTMVAAAVMNTPDAYSVR